MIPCRFAEIGCASPAAEIVYVPAGCICWPDPVQALCEQHLLTLETAGPTSTLLDMRVDLKVNEQPVVDRRMTREDHDALMRHEAGGQIAHYQRGS